MILYAILLSFLLPLPVSLHAMPMNLAATLIEVRVSIRLPGPYAKYVFFVPRLTATTIGFLL